MDRLSLFETFVRVAELGSFSAVARERNTTQPTISRQVAMLEAHLGCLLLQRSTRSVVLTDDGRQFYTHARTALESVALAETVVAGRCETPAGTLTLSCAAVLGRLHILPRLGPFLDQNPGLRVDLRMSDRFIDLTGEGVDLAIRVGHLPDTSLIARRIGSTRRVALATPGYLDRHGTPETPQDLAGHHCILYRGLAAGSQWLFHTATGDLAVPTSGRILVDTTEGLRAAILAGLGIGIAPIWHFVEGEIETGKLRVVLTDHEPEEHPIHAVYTTRRFLAPKIRAMIDYLAESIGSDPLFNLRRKPSRSDDRMA